MQFTALFITVLSIVLSVNAAAILTKRAAPNVQSCITNLDTTSVTEGGILNVNHDYNVLDDAMDDAQLNCCAITSAISDADASEVLGALGNTTPKVLNALNTIKSKEGSYNFLTKAIVRSHLSSFDDKTSRLNTCFNVFIPAASTSTLEGYFNQIKAAFTTTRAAYN
ncbi:hypothetical protein MBANPS3_009238 [Mucor bainieri]